MAKAHRGRTLKAEQKQSGRGLCPICKRSGIKVLYARKQSEKPFSTCKQCKAALAHGKANRQLEALVSG